MFQKQLGSFAFTFMTIERYYIAFIFSKDAWFTFYLNIPAPMPKFKLYLNLRPFFFRYKL